jgi:hypothetical protein
VVAGVANGRGLAQLNYHLDPSRPPQPPMLAVNPAPLTVVTGQTVLLSVSVTGSPPMRFTWDKDGTLLSNAQNAWLLLSNTIPGDSGIYGVAIQNGVGMPLTATLPLHVVVPPRFDILVGLEGLQLSLATVPGYRYFVEETAVLGSGWQPWPDPILGDGMSVLLRLTNTFEPGAIFFRLRVE